MLTSPLLSQYKWLSAGFYNASESTDIGDVICMKQPHFADVQCVTDSPTEWLNVDAMVTKTSHLKLTVRTADCGPILLADHQTKMVAAIHAGWKSALQGLIENTIYMMQMHGANLTNIVAAIGPHLQRDSFVVSAQMQALFPPVHQSFFTEKGGNIYFDFDAYLQMRLRHAGVEKIDSICVDTYTDGAYNSYRRDAKNPARQFSIIEILEG